jgi:hypothetical protein
MYVALLYGVFALSSASHYRRLRIIVGFALSSASPYRRLRLIVGFALWSASPCDALFFLHTPILVS